MKIDKQAYDDAALAGSLDQSSWESCMLAVAVGADSIEGCVTEGWPQWLAEFGVWYFDRVSNDYAERGERFLTAVIAAQDRGIDWDQAFNEVRLDSILPIALGSLSEGNEAWRVQCREAVQWSIDNGGVPNPEAAGAAREARAARAVWAAGGAARDRIEQSFFKVLENS